MCHVQQSLGIAAMAEPGEGGLTGKLQHLVRARWAQHLLLEPKWQRNGEIRRPQTQCKDHTLFVEGRSSDGVQARAPSAPLSLAQHGERRDCLREERGRMAAPLQRRTVLCQVRRMMIDWSFCALLRCFLLH